MKSQMKKLQELCHKIAIEKGFWGSVCVCKSPKLGKGFSGEYLPLCVKCLQSTSKKRNNAEMLMLMVSELGEACEGLRKDDWKNVAEELADCVIRVMDFCEARGIDLEKEILKKVKKNKKRAYKHGKKF